MGKVAQRALITGAGGFVGANLARRLLSNGGYEVHAFIKDQSHDWRIRDIRQDLVLHQVDITDYGSVRQAVCSIRPHLIFHLATYGAYPRKETDLRRMVEVQYIGTLNLVQAALDLDVRMFVNTGTTSEYGRKKKPMSEDDHCAPDIVYGAVKLGTTALCTTIANQYKKNICTLRLFSVYGQFEDKDRLFPYLILNSIDGKDIELGDRSQARDFIHVDDVTLAYIAAASAGEKVRGQVINIATGVQSTVSDAAEKVIALSASSSAVSFGRKAMESFESDTWVADTSKASKLLGWNASITLDAGIRKDIDWFRKNKGLYME